MEVGRQDDALDARIASQVVGRSLAQVVDRSSDVGELEELLERVSFEGHGLSCEQTDVDGRVLHATDGGRLSLQERELHGEPAGEKSILRQDEASPPSRQISHGAVSYPRSSGDTMIWLTLSVKPKCAWLERKCRPVA